MKIAIKKSEIFAEVEKQSAYVASTVEGGIHFDELWATAHDYDIMDSYWIEGCSSVVSLLMRYIRSESVEHNLSQHSNAEVLEIRIDMPDTFNDFLSGSIVSSMKLMLVNSILGSWLSVKYSALSERYSTLAKDFSEDIKGKLLYRNQPYQNRSEHVGEDTDNESVAEQFSKTGTDITDKPIKELYDTSISDDQYQAITEQFSKAGNDTEDEQVKVFYDTDTTDEKNQSITEQFSKSGTDSANVPVKETYEEGTVDTNNLKITEQFSKGQDDVKEEVVTDYFEKVETDNLILKQYEKCCYHP